MGTENPLKLMKNAFCFTLKALFVLKTFGHIEKRFDKEDQVNFKFISSRRRKQTSATYILPDISRSNRNQTIKFSQLIEYIVKNIFLDKSYTKWGGEAISKPFSEKPKLSISLD